MNRAERRKQEKLLRHAGLNKNDAKTYVERFYAHAELEEGQKVKLNYELMKRHPHFKQQPEEFKQWVEDHKDEILTVEWNKEKVDNNAVDKKMNVNLVEDTTDPKWLFYSDVLIPLATANIKLDDGTEKKVVLGDITDSKDPRIQEAIDKAMEETNED